MISGLRAGLRAGFELAESSLDRLFGPALNPFAQLGAIGFFLYWIVGASGLYLFAVFDTGLKDAFASVEWFTRDHWYHAGVMRSLHRYASDLMVVMMMLHLLREFAYDRYRGVRWFSWFTGLPVIWLVFVSGITGYWLVWDKLAQYVAITSTELLDWLPIFGDPIARNFLTDGSLNSRFFTLMIFLHVAVPLILLFLMWIHIQRISRPKINPPRILAAVILIGMIVGSLIFPAVSQGPAVLSEVPSPIGIDWFYLPLYPLADIAPGTVWALLGFFTFLVATMPWLPPLRSAKVQPAAIDLEHCNGCKRCVDDCPYEALQLVPRTDGLPYTRQVAINESKCVACGICMAACPSSTPFRRTPTLATGIDLPGLPLTQLREMVHETCAKIADTSPGERILTIACSHSAGAGKADHPVVLPCVSMVPPSMIDYILSRDLADGIVLAGCAERACYNRLGVQWTKERLAGERDPYLRARVPRERVATVWTARIEGNKFKRELDDFRKALAALGPKEKKPAREKPIRAAAEKEDAQ